MNCSKFVSCFKCTTGPVNCSWYDMWKQLGRCQSGNLSIPLDAVGQVKWMGFGCPDGPIPSSSSWWSTFASYYAVFLTVFVLLAVMGVILWCKIRNFGYQRFSGDVTAALNHGFPMNDLNVNDDEEEETILDRSHEICEAAAATTTSTTTDPLNLLADVAVLQVPLPVVTGPAAN